MTTYKELTGLLLKRQTTNPTDPSDGQVWYNNALGELKAKSIIEAWSAGSNTANAKQRSGGCGTQTAGLVCGGFAAPPGTAAFDGTEEYNGVGWSTGGTLNTARGNTKLVGIQTSAVFFGQGGGGQPQSGVTEEYNGTTWATVNPMSNAINYRSGCGVEDALIATGGNVPSTNRSNLNEEYDGSNWTNGTALPQKQSSQGQAGTATAAINSFGYTNNPVPGNTGDAFNTISLEYDGTNWTAGPNGNGVVQLTGYAMGSGTQTDAIFAGAPSTNSCKYDGTTFTVGPALAVAQDSAAHGSTNASATWIARGSPVPSVGDRVQEFNSSFNALTPGAWASTNNLNTARAANATATNSAADTGLTFGGNYPSGTDNSETYDGTSWTEGPNLPQAISYAGGAGTAGAALCFTGRLNPGPRINNTYEYDGSAWTAGGAYGAVQAYTGGAGTQTAGLGVSGETPPGTDLQTTYEYSSNAWTAGNNCNVAGYQGLVFGDAAGAIMGCLSGPPTSLETESYDGNNWTASSTAIFSNNQGGASGTYPSGLFFGGPSPASDDRTQKWDGTTWSTMPSLGTARRAKGSGVTAQALAQGGETPGSPTSNATEEFTPESTTVNIGTFSTS